MFDALERCIGFAEGIVEMESEVVRFRAELTAARDLYEAACLAAPHVNNEVAGAQLDIAVEAVETLSS